MTSSESANVLFDACWMVLIDRYGDFATVEQPVASRARIAVAAHADACRSARSAVSISEQLAARVVGFYLIPETIKENDHAG